MPATIRRRRSNRTTTQRARTSSSTCAACKPPEPKRSRVQRNSCTACKTTCVNCTNPLVTKTDASLPAQWLQDLERPAVPRHALRWKQLERQGFRRACGAPGANVSVTYTAAEGQRLPERVVYWAASGCSLANANELRGAERAYGDYSNMGVAVCKSSRGRDQLEFHIASPCAYIARGRGQRSARQWCRHLHFVALQSSSKMTWQVHPQNKNELFTLPVFPCSLLEKYTGTYSCVPIHNTSKTATPTGSSAQPSMFVSKSEYKLATDPKHGSAVGVCAIDDNQYPPIQKHDLVINWKSSESAIRRYIQSLPTVTRHTPLVVYCANPKCLAAQVLIEKLAHIGYCNVWYFKNGMGV